MKIFTNFQVDTTTHGLIIAFLLLIS